ncbi:TPA: metal transporter [Candidatus Bathyarchaeota archaeon]|nr:metal transporter [Candidatus Bathyarchaeota archaeon]
MHIPDGFLDLRICLTTYGLTVLFWIFAFKKAKEMLTDKQVPLMAVLTAMFFAAQMVNYPIVGGTTAHLLGGPILAITLGPYGGLISMTIILLIQALFFGDGGLTTLGANVWNMGVIGCFLPYIVWLLFPKGRRGMIAGAFLGAFIGDVAAAVSAGLEVGLSTKFLYGASIAVPTMAFHHSFIGVGEGIITAVIILALLRSRPDLLNLPKIAPKWLSAR